MSEEKKGGVEGFLPILLNEKGEVKREGRRMEGFEGKKGRKE